MKFSKGIVLAVVVLNVAFTTAVLFVFMRTGNEPSVLVGAWFAFTTAELWQLAGIKKHKIKEGEKREGSEFTAPTTEADCAVVDSTLQGSWH